MCIYLSIYLTAVYWFVHTPSPFIVPYLMARQSHLLPVVTRWTVAEGEGAGDEVVLHVHHHQSRHGAHHLHQTHAKDRLVKRRPL